MVNVTSMIRSNQEVVDLRREMRSTSKRFSATQLKAVMSEWMEKWNCDLYMQFLDEKFDVPKEAALLKAVKMTGTASEEYELDDNDCNRFAARLKGLLEVMLSDPGDNWNGASTVGRFNDFVAHHSFALAIVLDDKDNLKVIAIEPQSDREVSVSDDPKEIYNVHGSAEIEFG